MHLERGHCNLGEQYHVGPTIGDEDGPLEMCVSDTVRTKDINDCCLNVHSGQSFFSVQYKLHDYVDSNHGDPVWSNQNGDERSLTVLVCRHVRREGYVTRVGICL